MNMKRITSMKMIMTLLLALLLCLSFAACKKTDAPATESTSDSPVSAEDAEPEEEPLGEPIKIGHIVDLQGVEANTGKEAQRSLDFAFQMIGNKIGNHPIELITLDAQGSTTGATDVAMQLAEVEKVAAILGPTQIGEKIAVGEYMAEAQIPLIFYNSTPGYMFNANPWLIGSGGAIPQLPTAMAHYLYEEMGYRNVHVLSMDNMGYRSYLEPFMEVFQKLGGEILSDQWAPIPCADWSPYLTVISGTPADAIVAWASGSDAISLWKAWYETGMYENIPIVAAQHGGFTDYFILGALENSNPAIAAAVCESAIAPIMYVYDNDSAANKSFVEAWGAEFGGVPVGSNLPGVCAQAVLLLKDALESVDCNTDPEILRDAILAMDFTGPEGHALFVDSNAATKDVHICKIVKLDDGSYNYSKIKTYEAVPPAGLQ
jgi:branched-chain amino acid transport system substrate-binding protein